jgi:hypothetical protein
MNPMPFPDSDLTNARRRVTRVAEILDLQRALVQKLRADGKDTNDAEATFRRMRRTLETYEEDLSQIEDEVIDAKVSAWFGWRGTPEAT